jgi:hypothetical protein
MRQQQTSNPILLIQPTSVAFPGKPDYADGICAISTCRSTLELVPNTSESQAAAAHLQDLLDMWDGETEQKTSWQALSKFDIYENIPLSKMEIDAEWKRSCAFEDSGRCYLPTARIILSSWKAIIDASRAESIDMLDNSQQEKLWDAISDEGIPKELFEGIVSRARDTGFAAWIALCMLEAQGGQLPRSQFLESWRDLLPEKLLPAVNWDTVKVIFGSSFLLSSTANLSGQLRSI